ncbi:MAG: hypothetical protein HRU38_20640 [Saccharospirillaceae bacterium]|nr:hypothetical protein [Pseudomonadales bacterium]NRB81041.1 hypothetical protein [Saccharospirillaceae bacterium]
MRTKFVQIMLVSLFALSQSAFALEYYRYKDENGIITIDATIPPEYVKYGYEVLNSMGLVVRTELPELSKEEKLKQETKNRKLAKFEALKNRLNRLYRSPSDVDRALNSFEGRVLVSIAAQQRRIELHKNKFEDAQKKAGREEAHEKDISQGFLDQMEEAREYIHSLELSIAEKNEDILEKRIQLKYEREVMFIVHKERYYADYIDKLSEEEVNQLYLVPDDYIPREPTKEK